MYRNNNIPQEYNKLAEISDNYLVWVRESTLESGTSYSAYVQYLNPSFAYFLINNYKIKNGTSYTLVPNYNNNGIYSYIEDYDVDFYLTTFSVDDDYFTTNIESRSDYILILFGAALIITLFAYVIHQLSRLVVKGGI